MKKWKWWTNISFLAYLSSNCHIEIFATTQETDVKKEANKQAVPKLSKKQIAKTRLRAGEH